MDKMWNFWLEQQKSLFGRYLRVINYHLYSHIILFLICEILKAFQVLFFYPLLLWFLLSPHLQFLKIHGSLMFMSCCCCRKYFLNVGIYCVCKRFCSLRSFISRLFSSSTSLRTAVTEISLFSNHGVRHDSLKTWFFSHWYIVYVTFLRKLKKMKMLEMKKLLTKNKKPHLKFSRLYSRLTLRLDSRLNKRGTEKTYYVSNHRS